MRRWQFHLLLPSPALAYTIHQYQHAVTVLRIHPSYICLNNETAFRSNQHRLWVPRSITAWPIRYVSCESLVRSRGHTIVPLVHRCSTKSNISFWYWACITYQPRPTNKKNKTRTRASARVAVRKTHSRTHAHVRTCVHISSFHACTRVARNGCALCSANKHTIPPVQQHHRQSDIITISLGMRAICGPPTDCSASALDSGVHPATYSGVLTVQRVRQLAPVLALSLACSCSPDVN